MFGILGDRDRFPDVTGMVGHNAGTENGKRKTQNANQKKEKRKKKKENGSV
jgi:hypothetical protein